MNHIFRKLLITFFTIINIQIYADLHAAQPPIITRQTKANLSPDLAVQAQDANMSLLQPSAVDLPNLYRNYPDGAILFPKDPDIAAKFNTMVKSIQTNPDLIVFFRKIHITTLNQLYDYIMKIYTNLNLTNPGYNQTTESPTADIQAYLTEEATYATNKKKLIINHLINIIHAQFAGAINSYNSSITQDTAVPVGKIFIQNDYGLDLTYFTTQATDPDKQAKQKAYFNFLQEYMDFFQTYTAYLSKIDSITGINQYAILAQHIKNLLEPSAKNKTPLTMNPNMFFYDTESMRSIQFIPFFAGTIPSTSKLIPWAPEIIRAATSNLNTNGHAVAYFKDAQGNKTQNKTQATTLYLLVETGPYLFEQELLAQPGWLNTQDGTIRILRACLGDCTAIVGMGILDQTLETILEKIIKNSSTSKISGNKI